MYIKIPCDQVSFELKKMGVHPTGIALMAPKAVVEPLRLVGVRAPGANIIKQEMLAMGADAANAKGTINCSIERTEAVPSTGTLLTNSGPIRDGSVLMKS